jgi:3-oxoacyl-[acyl-carrier protein] reductase
MSAAPTVLVIGGGTGIGRATCLALAAAGSAVIVADRDETAADHIRAEIIAGGGTARTHILDVRDRAAVTSIFDEVGDFAGGIDAMVMIVGGANRFSRFRPFHQLTDEEVDLLLDVNLHYVLWATRAAIRYLRKRGQGGVLIGIGSIAGLLSAPNHAPYGLSKAALMHLARTVTLENGAHGIRMNLVSPGVIPTDSTASIWDEETKAILGIPAGRPGRPEDIANVVKFLLAPEAAYIAGQTICVDGGASAKFYLPTPGTEDPE